MLRHCLIIAFIFAGQLFAKSPSADTACTPVISIKESKNDICIGSIVTFYASVANHGTNQLFLWKKNNINTGVNNTDNYTAGNFKDGDIVTCEYSCKTRCGIDTMVTGNPVIMHVLNDITPIITIANNDSLICEEELTVFTSEASYGNAVPFYQWMVNGNPVGTNSPLYSTDSLTNGSRVECRLNISVPACPGITTSASSQITIYVYPTIHPRIKIAGKTEICRGEQVTFTATANGGAYPTFAWELNGKPTGEKAQTFTSGTLQEGDRISCTVTIDQDSRCHTSTSAPSNEVVMHVHDYIDPTVTITAPFLSACAGTPLMFTATAQNAGDYKMYQWQVNGKSAGNNSSIFINNEFSGGDTVNCVLLTGIPGCAITANVTSNFKVVDIKEAPVITFSPPEITVMSGEPALLDAAVSGNAFSFGWQPGELLLKPQSLTSLTVPLTHDTTFTLTVVDINGCTASKEINIKVLYKLYMPSAFTPNKDHLNEVFRIPPGASVSLHEFSVFDRWGQVVFSTKDIRKGWNGTYKGENSDAGTYIYLIKGVVGGKESTIKGTVILLR